MLVCAKHRKTPVKGYSPCAGCEVERLRAALVRAQEEMRERCAVAAHELWIRDPDESPLHAIRAMEVKP